ncbi:TolB family protein [Actinokineospora sp.]|uniref:TolB family protein n=1 Tax=Actinokineospora sp. TaxID=1872133 RepID=UPI00403838A4
MKDWFVRHRIVAGVLAIVVVVAAATLYVVSTVREQRAAAARPGAAVPGGLEFVDNGGGRNLVSRLAPDGARSAGELKCLRVYSAGGTTVCLRMGVPGAFEAAVFDASGKQVRAVPLPGTPSRARVSASGRIVSWTVFVTGDSYLAPGGFSTRTGVLDLRTGTLTESLENFDTIIEGKLSVRIDANFWGVTVAADDRTFYATLGAGKSTWLVKGDLFERTMTTMRTGAECPSLSPDQTRVAYKKRAGRLGGWQLFVLDLASGRETALPGSDGVDDQAAWLDDSTLAYAKVPTDGVPTIYASAADGTGRPRELVAAASSPSPRG